MSSYYFHINSAAKIHLFPDISHFPCKIFPDFHPSEGIKVKRNPAIGAFLLGKGHKKALG